MALMLYNTLSRKKETFRPLRKGKVGLYTCGPTVYWFAHIGNLRTYIFEDILRRALEYNGYKVNQVMNITDVGHLTSDADTGEDKMEKGAKREGKTAWEIAKFYTEAFQKDIKRLNIEEPTLWVKATDHIKEQIRLIKVLEKKGFTYKISDGIYFDTSELKDYGKLAGPGKRKIKAGARVAPQQVRGNPELYRRIEMVPGKKNPTDFALWKFSKPNVKRQMEWESPWGRGFPGWHTECVAMSAKYLGIPFDIHTGGIDHIPIHHTNEIAQAEAAFGKVLAKFWLHGEFLLLKGGRMGKSEGNIINLDALLKKGFNPLAYRYLCLTAHHLSKLSFSWQNLKAAQNALDNLYQKIIEIKSEKKSPKSQKSHSTEFKAKFLNFINDDLNIPKALALTWNLIKNQGISNQEKYKLLLDFDKVLGLDFDKIKKLKIPQEIKELIELREQYRKKGDYKKSDEIRMKIKEKGWWIEDTKEGSKIKRL
jgi:cysteinyl-tRNA synthetase